MIVADGSALVEYLLRTDEGIALEERLTAPGADIHVPAVCDVEVTSALRGLLLGDRLTTQRCEKAVRAYLDLPLTRHGHTNHLTRILELRHNMSAYDATYVALAEGLDAALLTADRRLEQAVREHTSVRLAG